MSDDLMKPILEERAENYAREELIGTRVINSKSMFSLGDYVRPNSKLNVPYFLVGPKGSGKTLPLLKILRACVNSKVDYLPAMFIYQKNKELEMLDPLTLASEEEWGSRLEILNSDLETILEKANPIVFDDIHYVCEAIKENKFSKDKFIDFLESVCDASKKNKRVILVSEEILSAYSDIISDKRFNQVIKKIGIYDPRFSPNYQEELAEYKAIGNPLALKSIASLCYEDWCNFLKDEKINFDPKTKHLIFKTNPAPRAAIKTVNYFGKKTINFEDILKEAENIVSRSSLNKNEKTIINMILKAETIDYALCSPNDFKNLPRQIKDLDLKIKGANYNKDRNIKLHSLRRAFDDTNKTIDLKFLNSAEQMGLNEKTANKKIQTIKNMLGDIYTTYSSSRERSFYGTVDCYCWFPFWLLSDIFNDVLSTSEPIC